MPKIPSLFNFNLLIILFLSISILACNRANLDCPQLWKIENTDNQKVTIKDGILSIETRNMEIGSSVVLTQEFLDGNFIAFLNFSDFKRDVNGSYLRLFVRAPGQNAIAAGTMTDISPSGSGLQLGAVIDLSDSLGFGDSADYVPSDAEKGQFSIYRDGSVVTVTASDQSGNIAENTISFNSEPMVIGIEIGSITDQSGTNARTSVNITSFTTSTLAVGGGETDVLSDDFECNSIKED